MAAAPCPGRTGQRWIAAGLIWPGILPRISWRLAWRSGCTIALAYAIGKAEPVAVDIDTHGTSEYTDDMLEQAVRSVLI